jgi:lysozyme
MTPHPRLSKTGIELVKRFEGLRRKAARLDNGGWTIGYGHTVSAREGAEVTPDQAEILLLYDLDKVARAIDPLVFTPLNANQFNALVAFAFNIGLEHFRTCAVLKRVNEGAYLQAGAAIELWRRASFEGDNLVVDGLVRRRAAEKVLFFTPMDGFRPVPTPVVRPAYDGAADDLRNQARGLASATDLYVPLDVTDRLQQLFPEPPPREPDPLDLAAPRFHQPEPQPEPAPPPSELVTEPAVEALAEPAPAPVVEEAPLFIAEAAAPAPHIFEPPPRYLPVEEYEPQTAELPITDFGRRQMVEPAPQPKANASAPYLVLVAGLIGALMFVGALLAMIYGKATLLNLGIGLVGVVCMVPAGLRVLLGLFGERSRT